MFFHLPYLTARMEEWSKALWCVPTSVSLIPQLSKSYMYNSLAIFAILFFFWGGGGVFCTPFNSDRADFEIY